MRLNPIFLTLFFSFAFIQIHSAQIIIQSDNFDDGAQLNWELTNTHLVSATDWMFTDNGGNNIDGTGMAIFDDDAAGAQTIGSASITSPVADITQYDEVFLEFVYNYRHYSTGTASSFFVEVLKEDGTWEEIFRTAENDCGDWGECTTFNKASIDVTSLAHIGFQVRFTYDDGGHWAYYTAIDNYLLYGYQYPDITYTTVEDCDNGEFLVEVTVNDMGTTSQLRIYTDNEELIFTEVGSGTLNSFPFGTPAKLDIHEIHGDGNENFKEDSVEHSPCPQSPACLFGSPDYFCYPDNYSDTRLYQAAFPIKISFTEGTIQTEQDGGHSLGDRLVLYDGKTTDAPILFDSGVLTFSGDLSGLEIASTNEDNYLLWVFESDGSNSCQTEEQTSWRYIFDCPCEFPMFNFNTEPVPSCKEDGAYFSISLDDMGTATSVTFNFSNPDTDENHQLLKVTEAGIYEVGPFDKSGITIIANVYIEQIQGCENPVYNPFLLYFPNTCVPVSDHCKNAVELTYSSESSCEEELVMTYKAYSTLTEGEGEHDCTIDNGDMWLKTTVPLSGQLDYTIRAEFSDYYWCGPECPPPPSPEEGNLYFEVYEGICGDMTKVIDCTNELEGSLTNLTPNATLYFRIWDNEMSTNYPGYHAGAYIYFCLQGYDCVAPIANINTQPNCENGTATAQLEVTDLGSDGTFDLYLDNDLIQTIDATGTYDLPTYNTCATTNIVLKTPTEVCEVNLDGIASCLPDNDVCTSATSLNFGDDCVVINSSICGALNNDFTSDCGDKKRDIWYQFELTKGRPTVTFNAEFMAGVELYSGECNNLTQISCHTGKDVTFTENNLTIGATYFIRIYQLSDNPLGGEIANFSICVACNTPANDICEDATYIGDVADDEQTIMVNNFCASGADAPNFSCYTDDEIMGNGVWLYLQKQNGQPHDPINIVAPNNVKLFVYRTSDFCFNRVCMDDALGQGTNDVSIPSASGFDAAEHDKKSAQRPGYYIYAVEDIGAEFLVRYSTKGQANPVLPIEWTEFKGYTTDNTNVLTWTTTTEINIQSFVIQRSADGQKAWHNIDQLTAKDHPSAYQWIDTKPLPTAYYRLQSIEEDGTHQLSKLIYLQRNVPQNWQVFPLPARDIIQISLSTEYPTNYQLQLTDINGQLLQQQTWQLLAGNNEVKLTIDHLPSGVYLLILENENQQMIKRVVKE